MLDFSKYLTCENMINIILIVVIIILIVNIIQKHFLSGAQSEPLTNISTDTIDRFKRAQIVVYKTNSCGYCNKFMKLLNDHDLTEHTRIVDVNTQTGKIEYSSLGEKGVPVIRSETTGEIYVGYTDNIDNLLNKLKM